MRFSLHELFGWITAIATALAALRLVHIGVGVLILQLLLLMLLVRLGEIWPKPVVILMFVLGSIGIFAPIAWNAVYTVSG